MSHIPDTYHFHEICFSIMSRSDQDWITHDGCSHFSCAIQYYDGLVALNHDVKLIIRPFLDEEEFNAEVQELGLSFVWEMKVIKEHVKMDSEDPTPVIPETQTGINIYRNSNDIPTNACKPNRT